jgi:hypothetical protein
VPTWAAISSECLAKTDCLDFLLLDLITAVSGPVAKIGFVDQKFLDPPPPYSSSV